MPPVHDRVATCVRGFGSHAAVTGEAPFWDAAAQRLLWVDIRGGQVLASRWPDGATKMLATGKLPVFVAPRGTGGLITAFADGIHAIAADGEVSFMSTSPELDPGMRLNDAVIDRQGRMIVGSMALDWQNRPQAGVLYQVDRTHGWRCLLKGLGVVNGLAIAPDGTSIYVSDSNPAVRTIWRFAYDGARALLSDRRVVADFGESELDGLPDGAAMALDGSYWIAAHGAGALLRFDSDDRLLERYRLPIASVSKPAFVGPGLDCLAVTSFAGVPCQNSAFAAGIPMIVAVDQIGLPLPVLDL